MVNDTLSKITLLDVDKSYFIRCHGAERVSLVDCRRSGAVPDQKKKTLGDFLSNFGVPRSVEDPIWKIKVVQQLC